MAGDRTIWLARHAERLDFADPTWVLQAPRPYDPPLSDLGRKQAHRLGLRLRSEAISEIFSSPFLRAVETAAAASKLLRLPIRIEPGLSEWLNTEWFREAPETMPIDKLWRCFPSIDRSYRPIGLASYGETENEALLRAGEVARRIAVSHPGNNLLVGHGASVLGATLGLLQTPVSSAKQVLPEIRPASVVKVVFRRSRWWLELACDETHLE